MGSGCALCYRLRLPRRLPGSSLALVVVDPRRRGCTEDPSRHHHPPHLLFIVGAQQGVAFSKSIFTSERGRVAEGQDLIVHQLHCLEASSTASRAPRRSTARSTGACTSAGGLAPPCAGAILPAAGLACLLLVASTFPSSSAILSHFLPLAAHTASVLATSIAAERWCRTGRGGTKWTAAAQAPPPRPCCGASLAVSSL